MNKGNELFVLRASLLAYLYDNGAVSRRVATPRETIITTQNLETLDYLTVCDTLVEAGFIKTMDAHGNLEADAPHHDYIWLTETGFQHVRREQTTVLGIDVGIFKERLAALRERMQLYYRNVNELELREASYGLNAPLEIRNQIDAFKQKIAQVEQDIDDTVQQLQRLQP